MPSRDTACARSFSRNCPSRSFRPKRLAKRVTHVRDATNLYSMPARSASCLAFSATTPTEILTPRELYASSHLNISFSSRPSAGAGPIFVLPTSPASSRRRSVSFGTVGASFATRVISPRTIVLPSAHRFTASNLACHSWASRSAARREEAASSATAAPGARRPTLGICAKCARANAEGVGARSMVPLLGQEGGGRRRAEGARGDEKGGQFT